VENSLKQRIIGAVVLAALAIIFLPAILKEKASNGPFVSQIPEQPPELREYVVDKKKIRDLVSDKDKIKNQLDKLVADSRQPSDVKEPLANDAENGGLNREGVNKRKSKVSSAKGAEPQVIAQTEEDEVSDLVAPAKQTTKPKQPLRMFADSAWVVQVASFAKESNAINLIKKLKASQFKAYRRKVTANNQPVYRVFVGPYIEKKDATRATTKISTVSETSVVVMAFEPVSF